MSKKTKITIAITAAAAVTLILALKYWKSRQAGSSNGLPQNARTAGASSLGTDVPIATPQAITEAAFNQTPSMIGDPIDDPSAEDTGVLTLQ